MRGLGDYQAKWPYRCLFAVRGGGGGRTVWQVSQEKERLVKSKKVEACDARSQRFGSTQHLHDRRASPPASRQRGVESRGPGRWHCQYASGTSAQLKGPSVVILPSLMFPPPLISRSLFVQRTKLRCTNLARSPSRSGSQTSMRSP
jgi:hypothetical protein